MTDWNCAAHFLDVFTFCLFHTLLLYKFYILKRSACGDDRTNAVSVLLKINFPAVTTHVIKSPNMLLYWLNIKLNYFRKEIIQTCKSIKSYFLKAECENSKGLQALLFFLLYRKLLSQIMLNHF